MHRQAEIVDRGTIKCPTARPGLHQSEFNLTGKARTRLLRPARHRYQQAWSRTVRLGLKVEGPVNCLPSGGGYPRSAQTTCYRQTLEPCAASLPCHLAGLVLPQSLWLLGHPLQCSIRLAGRDRTALPRTARDLAFSSLGLQPGPSTSDLSKPPQSCLGRKLDCLEKPLLCMHEPRGGR